jgi:hypothetical protein
VPASDIAHGLSIYLSGEDTGDILLARRAQLTGGHDSLILEVPSDGRDIATILESLEPVDNVALLVVDPARKFIRGSEDESDNINEFLAALERFSVRKRCAVVVTHHLRRNARPSSLAGVLEKIRGSQTFIDRARSVIGMRRHRQGVEVGVLKHNIPPACGMMQDKPQCFALDAETLRLRPVDDTKTVEPTGPASETAEEAAETAAAAILVTEAITAATARGLEVTRTGKCGVFERELPELAGLPRATVRAATNHALKSGAIRLDGHRLLPAENQSATPLPPLPATAATATGSATKSQIQQSQ